MLRYIRLSPILLLLLAGSCKKNNGLDSKDLLVYMQGDFGDANNAITAELTLTPIAVWGNTVFQFPVYSTRQMAAAANVTITPDSSGVAAFNKKTGSSCILLPSNTYTIDITQLTIHTDSMQSGPLTVTITNPAALTDTNGYVLPLTITKVTGKDEGVAISSNRATAYLYIPYAYTNVDTVQTLLSGTIADRTGWMVTVSNTTSGSLGPAMLDGSNSTAWRSSNSSTAAKWVVLSLPVAQTVRGLQLTPDYVSTGDNATRIRVSSSPDSVTWSVQGIWNGTGPASGTNATNPDFKGINFLSPVQARYFRLDILKWVSGSRTGIGELNAIQ
ncbi:MAG TPA: DUF1735 domain-containing protein [Puia sp.]|jgi:hypothetical protein|nr:DUF1735 domain-containing protein [Puia sp.]